jgi:hypothetical protein
VDRREFASEAQVEQFLDAAEDIIDKDGWNPSHGMIDKSWAERNALEEGICLGVCVDVF